MVVDSSATIFIWVVLLSLSNVFKSRIYIMFSFDCNKRALNGSLIIL
jgi:hypothetical protein